MEEIDYKDAELLKRFTSAQAKIVKPRYTASAPNISGLWPVP